jgi:4-hydroxy-2-oxoheptanedioate aldolase
VYAGSDYFEQANNTVLTFAMIETKQAVQNVEDIVSVLGLDAVYVGPADLSITLQGKPQMEYEGRPDLLGALEQVVAACKKHGVQRGIHCSGAAHAQKMIALGFNFVTLLSDHGYLAQAVSNAVKELRSGVSAGAVSGNPY